MKQRGRARRHDQPAVRSAREGRDGAATPKKKWAQEKKGVHKAECLTPQNG
jgi:hypothetical protein